MMKLDLRDFTLCSLKLVHDVLWLIAGVSIGAWGAATQPESIKYWQQPNVPGLIAGMFAIIFVVAVVRWGLDKWWNRKEAA